MASAPPPRRRLGTSVKEVFGGVTNAKDRQHEPPPQPPPSIEEETARSLVQSQTEMFKSGKKLSLDDARQLGIGFMYEDVKGTVKEEEEKPEDCIPDLPENQEAREFLKNAPTKGLWMPLGKQVKVMQCWRCKGYGHRTGDRECPMVMGGNLILDAQRQAKEDPMSSFVGKKVIMSEAKEQRRRQLQALMEEIRREKAEKQKRRKKAKKKKQRKRSAEEENEERRRKKRKRSSSSSSGSSSSSSSSESAEEEERKRRRNRKTGREERSEEGRERSSTTMPGGDDDGGVHRGGEHSRERGGGGS